MTELSPRALNRTYLRRQGLLERPDLSPLEMVRHLGGMQAQDTSAPYIGLCTRIGPYDRGDVETLIAKRHIVRATLMRSTLHLVTADDYLAWWNVIQPVFAKAFRGFFPAARESMNVTAVANEAERFMANDPHTFASLRAHLVQAFPDQEPNGLSYAARAHVPMVESAPSGRFRFRGSPEYILAEHELGKGPGAADDGIASMIARYLSAYGPASVADFQTWSGLTGAKTAFTDLAERGEIEPSDVDSNFWDVPGGRLVDPTIEAPVKLLPAYDNAILSHRDRSRITPDEFRKRVHRGAGIVNPTYLVDGFVAGTWKLARDKRHATIAFAPFTRVKRTDRSALESEALRLLAWTDPELEAAVTFEA